MTDIGHQLLPSEPLKPVPERPPQPVSAQQVAEMEAAAAEVRRRFDQGERDKEAARLKSQRTEAERLRLNGIFVGTCNEVGADPLVLALIALARKLEQGEKDWQEGMRAAGLDPDRWQNPLAMHAIAPFSVAVLRTAGLIK